MTVANVALYAAILGFVIYRRVQGRPADSARALFVLPVVLTILGYQDIAHRSLDATDIAFAVVGCAATFLLGALRGTRNTIEMRNGTPWVRWGRASVAIFAVNIATKLLIDLVGIAAGGSTDAATSSLLLSAGLMLLGEAGVVWLRIDSGRAAGRSPHVTGPGTPAPRASGFQAWAEQPPAFGLGDRRDRG